MQLGFQTNLRKKFLSGCLCVGFIVLVLDSTRKPGSFSGTSASAPHVAGVLALLWSAFPKKSADEIRDSVIKTATDLGPPGWDDRFGYGLVNATAAIEFLGAIDKNQSQILKENLTPNSTLLKNTPVKPEYFLDGFIKVTGPVKIDKPGNYRISRDILQNGKIFPLFINCSDVTLDGSGHTISGVILGEARPRFQTGLFIHNRNRIISNITIKNLQFRDLDTGMLIGLSRDILVENCSFIGNFIGLSNYQSKNITIQGSLLTGNDAGIVELRAVNSKLQGNILN